MSFLLDDTIAAVASPPGSGLRGLVRISGQQTRSVLERLLNELPFSSATRSARYQTTLAFEGFDLPIDLFLWPTNRSFTGEPVAELHFIGAPPVVADVLEQVLMSGARPANRGEFTLRAFLAGRIDLVQAEAVLGVIDAGDEHELQSALSQLAGGISNRIADVHEQLLLHLADLEAGLDFVDEDIEFVVRPELIRRLDEGSQLLEQLLSQASDRMQSTGRRRIVLGGLPNAGKSTLFNQLIGRQAAIVSTIPGTTRDYLTASLQWKQETWELIDTAGWEQGRNEIEEAASAQRNDQFHRADLILWCRSAALTEEEFKEDEQLLKCCRSISSNVLEVITQIDRIPSSQLTADSSLQVSAATGMGIDQLFREISASLSTESARSDMISSTAARCSESLRHAFQSMQRARELTQLSAGDELISVELRETIDHLGRIVGRVYTDDILDRIFSRFCIGK